MQIYITRNNEKFGPYSREAVLEYLKHGIFEAHDYACFAGMTEWKTLSDLLGIAGKNETGVHPVAAASVNPPAPAAPPGPPPIGRCHRRPAAPSRAHLPSRSPRQEEARRHDRLQSFPRRPRRWRALRQVRRRRPRRATLLCRDHGSAPESNRYGACRAFRSARRPRHPPPCR